MKKITAFIGTARKKHTHYAVQRFLSSVASLGSVEHEIVALTDYRVEVCRGPVRLHHVEKCAGVVADPAQRWRSQRKR